MLRSAALMLIDWALALRDGHTVAGKWEDEDATTVSAHREHDRMLKRAVELRRIANQQDKLSKEKP